MLYSLTTRVACISRLVLAVVALVALGAAPTGADQCTRAKLKAIGKKESGLLACQARVAASGDSSGLSACESKVMAKFSHAFGNAGTCTGDQTACGEHRRWLRVVGCRGFHRHLPERYAR